MIEQARFVLCFLQRGQRLLMIHRNKAPNKGKWNCVGGHIESGESPYIACLREVQEETGFTLAQANFHGLLTWEGFEIPLGALYMFSSLAPKGRAVPNGEGDLAWKSIRWVLRNDAVVDNLHIVTPQVLSNVAPRRYHFVYHEQHLVSSEITPLPGWVDIHQPVFF